VKVEPHERGFGAAISDVDLTRPLSSGTLAEIRNAWLRHQVVYFPDQPLDHDQLTRFSLAIGPFGDDPYVESIEEHENIIEIRREPDEKASPFGASWHSDWSFQATPPAATILHSKVVPPLGGDTLYADGCAAYEALDSAEKKAFAGLTALHSARRPYSPKGFFASGGTERSMKILPNDSAYEVQEHPLIRTHPETGRNVLWINSVYTIGIRGMTEEESAPLLKRLFEHSTDERFIYRHRWSANMLTLWDNRSVQHAAQGGYDGHRRVMHRTTVRGDAPYLNKGAPT